jgi:hypothetical protein
MDWNNLRDQVSNLSLYDVKASIRKVQNGRMRNGRWRNMALSCVVLNPCHSRHELHGNGGESP